MCQGKKIHSLNSFIIKYTVCITLPLNAHIRNIHGGIWGEKRRRRRKKNLCQRFSLSQRFSLQFSYSIVYCKSLDVVGGCDRRLSLSLLEFIWVISRMHQQDLLDRGNRKFVPFWRAYANVFLRDFIHFYIMI